MCAQRAPLSEPESPAPYIMRPQNSCEEFRFSEALKEDGCSLGCFSRSAQTVRLSVEHPQEGFFPCLPANLIVVSALPVTSCFQLQHTVASR